MAETTHRHSQLGIRHLIVWMAASGVILGGYRLADDLLNFPNWQSITLNQFFLAMAYGAANVSLFTAFERKRARVPMIDEPGFLFLLIAATAPWVDIAAMLVLRGILGPDCRWGLVGYADYAALHQAACFGSGGLILTACIGSRILSATWSLVFATLVACCVWEVFWHTMTYTRAYETLTWAPANYLLMEWWTLGRFGVSWLMTPAALAIAGVAIIDARQQRRSWRHWTGVGLWLALCLYGAVQPLLGW